MLKKLFLIFLALFFLGPIFSLFAKVDVALLQESLTSKSFLKSLSTTLWTGVGGTLISLGIGLYFAHFFAKYQWRGKRAQRLVLLIPYLIPNFVLASAYVIAWNPVSGILTPFLAFPGEIYGLWGMTFIFGIVHTPLVFLILEDKIQKIDPSFFEAAKISGASSFKIFKSIELPLLLPSLLSSFSLCFSLNISAFAIPAWLGAPEKAYTLTYKVYQTLQLGSEDGIPTAAGLSLILFLLAIPSLVLNFWIQKNEKKYRLISGKAARKSDTTLKPQKLLIFQGLYFISQCFVWILPLGALILTTFLKPGCLQQEGWSCLQDLSLRSYHYVIFELSETRQALVSSMLYGIFSSLAILAISLLTLLILFSQKRLLQIADWIFMIPLATPGAILALGLIVSYSGQYGVNLYNTAWIVVVAYILKHFNMAFLPIRNGLLNLHPSLIEASQTSGASPKKAWFDIVIPILKPDIMGVFFLVLIPILGELTMSVFLASPNFKSIGTVLFDLQDYADQASAGALSVLLILLILVMNQITRWISRGRLGY